MVWTADVVDNESLNKRSSKSRSPLSSPLSLSPIPTSTTASFPLTYSSLPCAECCIFHKQRRFDESSSEESDSDESDAVERKDAGQPHSSRDGEGTPQASSVAPHGDSGCTCEHDEAEHKASDAGASEARPPAP